MPVALDKQLIEFTRDDVDEVLDAFRKVISTANGWINVEPIVEAEVLDELRKTAPPAVVRLFSGRGSKIPFGTFVAGSAAKPAQVGLDHSAGPRIVPQLRESGIAAPIEWRLRQDHGKRGIVYDVPAPVDAASVVRWLLDAATFVATIELGQWWSAAVHVRRS